VHLRDVLDLVSKRHPGIILKFGGHAMAAGLTLREDAYATFAGGFDAAVRELSGKASFDPTIETDGSLETGYANAEVAGLLQQQVWGSGFPAPIFRDTFQVRQQRLLKDKHLKLNLERGHQRFDAIWFNHAESLPEYIDVAYRLDQNVWNGMVSAQLIIEYARAAD
jgi:single-stranded-DNA-specific exonuclease